MSEFKGNKNTLRFQAGLVCIDVKADNIVDQKNFTLCFMVSLKLCSTSFFMLFRLKTVIVYKQNVQKLFIIKKYSVRKVFIVFYNFGHNKRLSF